MHQISFGNSMARIDLNEFFYPMQLVEALKPYFEETCSVKAFKAGPDRIVVELRPKSGASLEELALSFCNNALAMRQNWD